MAQGKCSLLKPVENLTGTFFLFSQYAQDLTKQYSNPDSYRCLPSKFVALDLNFNGIKTNDGNSDFYSKKLGEIFQNYFENSNTFLRSKYKDDWNPEYSRTLLFQTLEKYNLVTIENKYDTNGDDIKDFGLSKNIQHIGDIDIYSFNNNEDGVGYNEIYCYISNQVKCTNYSLGHVKIDSKNEIFNYYDQQICGYEGLTPYNGLSYDVNYGKDIYIDKLQDNEFPFYSLGQYVNSIKELDTTFIPCTLDTNMTQIANEDRLDNGKILEKFSINAILILYDIVSKNSDGGETINYKNIPLGIYFTGTLDNDCIMSNQIIKYVNSEQIYNQGTSYGLRICNRFISNPLSTEIIETTADSSSNVSEIAPVLEKIGEVLLSAEEVTKSNNDILTVLNTHLSQFKNNKTNIPYIRELGKKKYWFVNGKNTGAIAQYETTDPEDLKNIIISEILENVYSKDQVIEISELENYYTKEDINSILGSESENNNVFATKSYVNEEINKLREELKIYQQNE
jgi:hypothetical protein